MSDSPEIRGALSAGTVLQDRYTIDKPLGRGGFAITYLCRSGMYDKLSAVKEFMPASLAHREADGTVHPLTPDDADFFERGLADFIDEGRRLVECMHPNVVKVEDHFEERGTAYLVMEFIEGDTLYDHLLTHGPLDVRDIIKMMQRVLDALSTVHSKDLLHRDLTPSNIILRDSDMAKPVLIDFGAARHSNGLRSATIAQVCSDGYSPPEQYQAREEQTPALDIYAVGCIAYRCLTGERPPRSIDRYSRDVVSGWGERFKGSPAGLVVPVIAKSIELDPANRQQSADELAADLAGVAKALDILDQLDGEAGSTDRAADGLYWTVQSDGSVELSGTLNSLSQYEELIAKLGGALPGLNVINHAELRTTFAPDAALPSTRPDETETVQVSGGASESAQNSSDPVEPPRAQDTEPESATATDIGVEPATASDASSALPKKRFSRPAWAKIAAALIGLITAAGGIYLFAGDALTNSPGGGAGQSGPDNPFNVSISLPNTRYAIGDELTFTVRATRSCYYSVHTVDAEGTHEVHDPREQAAFMGSRRLKAGESRTIPIPNAPGKAIIKAPKGEYQIFAVCGRKDLQKIGLINDRLKKARKSAKRSFKFVFDEELKGINRDLLARAAVTYIVE